MRTLFRLPGFGWGISRMFVLALLIFAGFSAPIYAETYWQDSRSDGSSSDALPRHRSAEEACLVGELIRRIDGYQENDHRKYRYRSMNLGPDDGFGSRLCQGVIERRFYYPPVQWVPVETVSAMVWSYGSPDACNIVGYSDAVNGQCGPPKCTGECCGDCGGAFGGGSGGGFGAGSGGAGSNGSNPIHTASGNKYQRESDLRGVGNFPLSFERFYNSNRTVTTFATPLGYGWTHSYLARINVVALSNGTTLDTAYAYRSDGRILTFTRSGNVWNAEPDVPERLSVTIDGQGNYVSAALTMPNDTVEQYDELGRLVSLANRAGFVQTLKYTTGPDNDAQTTSHVQVQSVTDPEGRALVFGYTAGQLTSLTDSTDQVWSFGYSNGNLVTASYPDDSGIAKVRTYRYNEPGQTGGANLPHALTGIEDENGARFASWGYTAQGRANLSVHGLFNGTIDRTSFVFNPNGTTTVTDALGQSRVSGFDVKFGVARLSALDVPCDYCGTHTKAETYAANGYPDLVTDFRNFQTNYDYDSRGLQTQRIEALGQPEQRVITTTWHPGFRVPQSVVEPGRTTSYTHNARGQVLTQTLTDTSGTNEAPRMWTYVYCDAVNLNPPDPIGPGENLAKGCPRVGLLRRMDGPRTDLADRTTYEYRLADDPGNNFRQGDLWKTTNALGHVVEIVRYDGAGRVLRMKDANSVVIDQIWHPRGWLASRTVRANADGSPSAADATSSFLYDDVGNLVRTTQPDGVFFDYRYDNAHRLDRITDTEGNHLDFTLDALGHRVAEKTFSASDPNTPTRLLTRSYTVLSRLDKTFNAQGQFHQFAFDGNGNRTDRTDPLGVKTRWTFDALNRLKTTVGDYLGSDPGTANATTTTNLDPRDNVVQVNDPDNLATTYGLDGQNNLDQLSSPDTGTTTYTQDASGNRKTQTDARGVTSTFSYDALNRLIGIGYPTNSLNVTFVYDEPNAATGCAMSFPVGRLTRAIDASGSTVYCYDRRGNLIEKRQATASYLFTTRYSYDLADRMTGIVYASGTQVAYARDLDGRIQSVTVTPPGGSATPLLTNITYRPFGPASIYAFTQGGQTLTKTFDANYWMTDVTSNALNLHFRRDALGNIDRLGNNPGANPPTEQYIYDPLYRLSDVQDGLGSLIEGYDYTKTGDRISKAHPPAATQVYGYQPNTHRLNAIAGNARLFDAAGNTIQTTGTATLDFTYDDRNRMTVVKRNGAIIANYLYNAQGERVRKAATFPTYDSRWFVYGEGSRLLGDYTATTAREIVWVDSTPVALIDLNGTVPVPADRIFANGFELPPNLPATITYLHTDQLDTPRAASTPAGTVIWRWDWQSNPFGETLPNEDPDVNGQQYTLNLRFPGQYFDSETGLNYNYFRDYEPGTGRYIESDPMGVRGGINTYDYVRSMPLRGFDPLGLEVWVGCPDGSVAPYGTCPTSPDDCPNDAELCKRLGECQYDICCVFGKANQQRNAGNWNDPTLRTIENFAYAACYAVPKPYVYMHQLQKLRPGGGTTQFSMCALKAGLRGSDSSGMTDSDWKKHCKDGKCQ